MFDLTQVLNWVGLLDIGFISGTIPAYAISVAFYGRESKRTTIRLEEIQKELTKKLEAQVKNVSKGAGLESLKKEIKDFQNRMTMTKKRGGYLSVKEAFLLPIFVFLLSLSLVVLGQGFLPENSIFALQDLDLSVVFFFLGATFLTRTFYAVQQAAVSK